MWTRELKTRVNACSIQGVVLRSKRSEDGWQKEGGLSRRSREEPCWQCSTKPWQLHKTRKKIVHEAAKVTWRIWKRVMLTVQHEAVKVTRTTWRWVAMIVLHRAMRLTQLKDPEKRFARNLHEGSGKESCWQWSIGVGTRGARGPWPPQNFKSVFWPPHYLY